MKSNYALGAGVLGIVIVACGGGLSISDANQRLGNDGSGEGDSGSETGAKKNCGAPGACGPGMGIPAVTCSDGSLGGNTGRCLETAAGGCEWENRQCPSDAGTATNLKWYMTCGAPVCADPGDDAGAEVLCPALGTPCTTKGEACGNPKTSCGAVHICDDHDPQAGPGGCPISTKKAKQDIAYVGDPELTRLHDETIRMKLATYRYKGPFVDPNDPNATHLGFIVEDQPQSLSVDRGHDRVDLYGYMSMAVATIQVQEKQLKAQAKQIAKLQQQVDALEGARK